MTVNKLGPLEMQILGLLKKEDRPLAVSEVKEHLKDIHHKDLAYTTVMTVLGRLFQKGVLTREKEGRQYLYGPSDEVQSIGKKILGKIQSALFHNEKLRPILSFIEHGDDLTTDELHKLKEVINQKIEEKKHGKICTDSF